MISLAAEPRQTFGKQLKGPRQEGKLPIIVYGPKEKPAAYFVEAKAFKKALSEAGESTLVSLKADGGEKDILIHDVAYHPVSGEPIHADLYLVDITKAIQVPVQLVFAGVPPAEKLGGILVKVLHKLEIEALPKDLPHEIKVDVVKLENLDSQILVKDLVLPAGVKAVNDPEEVVASITVAAEEPEAPLEPVDLSAIEVEKKGKKEEAGEGEAAATPAA